MTAWFDSKIVISRLTVPFENKIEDETFAKFPIQNFIDELVVKQLQRLRIPPSDVADEAIKGLIGIRKIVPATK